jgi:hypothetical protein
MEFQLIRIRLVNIKIIVYLNLNISYHFRRYLLVFLFKGYLVVNEDNLKIDINFCLVVCFQP